MMRSMESKTHGFRRSVLLVACLFMISAHACGKSETSQASKTADQAGDVAAKVTSNAEKLTDEVVKSASDIADKASQKAKEAYDAAGNAVEKTAEKTSDTIKAAGDMVNNAASNTSGTEPSSGELNRQVQDKADEVTQSADKQVGKALESVPSLPGK